MLGDIDCGAFAEHEVTAQFGPYKRTYVSIRCEQTGLSPKYQEGG